MRISSPAMAGSWRGVVPPARLYILSRRGGTGRRRDPLPRAVGRAAEALLPPSGLTGNPPPISSLIGVRGCAAFARRLKSTSGVALRGSACLIDGTNGCGSVACQTPIRTLVAPDNDFVQDGRSFPRLADFQALTGNREIVRGDLTCLGVSSGGPATRRHLLL